MDFMQDSKAPRLLIAFLLLGNVLLLPISGDEAYYYTWTPNLSWGYFDHPPLVAWIGSLVPQSFYRVLFTLIGLLVLISPSKNYLWALAAPGAHLFLGAAVPDTVMIVLGFALLRVFKGWNKAPTWKNTLVLGLLLGLLGIAKFHGVLLALALGLAHPSIFKRGQFYLVLSIALLVMLPYLNWLYVNDWITFQYHLEGRYVEPGGWKGLGSFILISIVLWWPLFVFGKDLKRWSKLLVVITFLLFGWASFRGSIEYHWLLVLLWVLPEMKVPRKGVAYVGLIMLVLHIALWVPGVRTEMGLDGHFREELATIEADDLPTVFLDQYQDAALYQWYSGEPSYCLSHPGIRMSQYALRGIPFSGKVRILNRLQMGAPLDGSPFHFIEQEIMDLQHLEVEIVDGQIHSVNGNVPGGYRWILYSYENRVEVSRENLGPSERLPELPASQEGRDRFLTLEKNWVPTQLWVPVL